MIAIRAVGACYDSGEGVGAINLSEARRWFKRAADLGDAVSQSEVERLDLLLRPVETGCVIL